MSKFHIQCYTLEMLSSIHINMTSEPWTLTPSQNKTKKNSCHIHVTNLSRKFSRYKHFVTVSVKS